MKAQSRGLRLGLPALTALLAFTACEQDPAGLAPTGSSDKYGTGITGYCNPSMHAQFEEYLDNDQGILWQLAGGVIDCETGGEISFTPSAWGPGYEVKLVIPDHAVSPTYPGYPDVFFSIAIPVSGPAGGRTSVPYEFHPDGIHFLKDVELTLCWPMWAGPPTFSGYRLLNIAHDMHENEVHYRVRDLKHVWPTAQKSGRKAEPDADLALWATGLEYAVDHFSRWEVVNGDGPDGILPPPDKHAVTLEAGDACWTDLPPDPDAPIRLIR